MQPTDSHITPAIQNLQRLSELFCERREQLAREAGLTVQQWCVLEKISEEHFMPSMFAKTRDSSAAAVSKVIRQLIDKGVIEVGVQEHDGRQRRYTLTRPGSEIVEKLRASRQRAIDTIWADFGSRELEQFVRFSEQLGDRLEAYIREQRNATPPYESINACAAVTTLTDYVESSALPVQPKPVAVLASTNKFID